MAHIVIVSYAVKQMESVKNAYSNPPAFRKDGFIRRTSYPVTRPHVEYDLTLLGEEVAKHVAALADWLEVNLVDIKASSLTSDN